MNSKSPKSAVPIPRHQGWPAIGSSDTLDNTSAGTFILFVAVVSAETRHGLLLWYPLVCLANAALRSIVRRDTGEGYEEFLTRLRETLGDSLVGRYGFIRLKSREQIHSLLKTEPEREALQNAGDALDRKTKGRWVAQALAKALLDLPGDALILVDAVRIERQVKAGRETQVILADKS